MADQTIIDNESVEQIPGIEVLDNSLEVAAEALVGSLTNTVRYNLRGDMTGEAAQSDIRDEFDSFIKGSMVAIKGYNRAAKKHNGSELTDSEEVFQMMRSAIDVALDDVRINEAGDVLSQSIDSFWTKDRYLIQIEAYLRT